MTETPRIIAVDDNSIIVEGIIPSQNAHASYTDLWMPIKKNRIIKKRVTMIPCISPDRAVFQFIVPANVKEDQKLSDFDCTRLTQESTMAYAEILDSFFCDLAFDLVHATS
jgi:hypothetical protein